MDSIVFLFAFYCYTCVVALCVLLAAEKNRNEFVGLICGYFFHIFALIYYCAVPPKEKSSN